MGMGLILNAISPLLHLAGASPLPLDVGHLFLVGSNILLLMVVQQRVAVLEFSLEKMSACPTPPSCSCLAYCLPKRLVLFFQDNKLKKKIFCLKKISVSGIVKDSESWHAAVHGVAKSQIRLSH